MNACSWQQSYFNWKGLLNIQNMQTKNILHFLWQNVHSAAIIWPNFFKKKKEEEDKTTKQ